MGGGTGGGTGGGSESLFQVLIDVAQSRDATIRRAANTALMDIIGSDSSFGKNPDHDDLLAYQEIDENNEVS